VVAVSGHPPVWARTRPLAYSTSLVSFATVAAPLLAGFALAALLELRGAEGRAAGVAVALFTLAVVLLLGAIQAGLWAAAHHTSPGERVAWYPEAPFDDYWLGRMREQQWQEVATGFRFTRIAQLAYNLGISAFLFAVVAALVPPPGRWAWPRMVAVALAAAAAALETVGLAGTALRRAPKPGDPPPVPADRLRATVYGRP
jgi:hypothetical protein